MKGLLIPKKAFVRKLILITALALGTTAARADNGLGMWVRASSRHPRLNAVRGKPSCTMAFVSISRALVT